MSISAPFFRALGRFALPSVLRSGGADAFMKSILSLDRQCCRYSACAQRPSAETSACIASVSLCSPFPCLLACRLIGIIEGEQGKKKQRERNDRIVAVEADNHSYAHVKRIRDLGKAF